MKTPPPSGKIEMMERSWRCFWLGLLSLLPVAGIPLSVMALADSWRAKLAQGDMWNPAERYRFWGCIMARFGLWVVTIVVTLVILIAYFS